MTNLVIAIVILGLVLYMLNSFTGRTKDKAYRWWYMPWFALLFSGVMFVIYHTTDLPSLSFFSGLLYEEYHVEAAYSLCCIVLWVILQPFLRISPIHNSLIGLFRAVFARGRNDKNHVLPFPYFIDEENVVRSKVGREFYRLTLKYFILIVAIVYALFFILIQFNILHSFYLKSSFGILGLLPLMEYFIYLSAEVPVEKLAVEDDIIEKSDFEELWQLFIDTFDNYSVAWKKTSYEEDRKKAVALEKDHNDDIDNLIKELKSNEIRANAIIERYDIITALMKLETVFDHVENQGRHILIALDIPNHFTKDQNKSFTDEIAAKLTEILRRSFTVYGCESPQTALNNNVVITSLSTLIRQSVNEEWMKKIGLIIVVNVFDKGVSNMFECRKFCYILQSVNNDYQVVFVTSHRRGVEPSLKNTWLTGTNMTEKRRRLYPLSEKQFFIAYDYEDFRDRFGVALKARPSEPLSSGSEMAIIALSSKNGDKDKVVTPVHYLDLAYSNVIEGKEELNKFTDLISDTFFVSKKDINDKMINHLLPVDQIKESQVFSVIYDVENNSPVMYSKWMQLGYEENFSIVVSKPYIFRDYFNANHDYFMTAPFAALQPQLCKSRLTLSIILLNMLQKAEMEEKKLRKLLIDYYDEDDIVSVSGIIRDLFKTYFSTDLANRLMTKHLIDFKNGEYHHQVMYDLYLLTEVNTPYYLNVVTVKDKSGNVLFDILYDLMYQNYDNGQTHSFSGKPYVIRDFNRNDKTLNVESINNSSKDILFYRAKNKVSVGCGEAPIEKLSSSRTEWLHPITGEKISISFEGFETDVRVNTVGWYEFYKYTIKGCRYNLSHSPERHYPFGKVMKITFCYLPKPEYRERINDIRMSLQILLYEAMQSVFPHHAQYLIISTIGDGDPALPWIFNDFECVENQDNQESASDHELSFYFIEDAHIDLGLIGAFAANEQNIWYVLQFIYDYLVWLTEGDQTNPMPNNPDKANYHDVSNWTPSVYDLYLERDGFDKMDFLKYGEKQLPPYFDIDLLINFIRDLFEDDTDIQKTNIGRQTRNDIIGSCDFCGRKMKNNEMTRLNDGRMRCHDCSINCIDTEEQFLALCDKVKTAFLSHLGIDFSTITYSAKLVSAVELHKVGGYKFSITNGYDIRKIIGLAHDTDLDEFFVENGYKPDKTFGIIAHEMTHIWQFNNEDFKKVQKTNADLQEGLAVWTDLFLSEKYGTPNIDEMRQAWLSRDDEYGRGLRFIMDHCPNDPYGYIQKLANSL